MGWRVVIHHYLMAFVEASRPVAPPTSWAQFIDMHGTTALKHREQENRTRSEKRLASKQVPPPETYKVIEESPTRVLAEVEKFPLLEVLGAHRFLVVKVDDQWKVDDIFYKCFCKNGVCRICAGKGYCTACNWPFFTRSLFSLLRQECNLCQGNRKCKPCGGKGRCEHCSQSPIPGWRSQTSILPEDNVSG